MQLNNPNVPGLPSETATAQQVIQRLQRLVTNNTSVGLLEAMPETPIRCPASLVDGQPEEEADLRWCGRLPNDLGAVYRCGSKEHRPISGRSRVLFGEI